MWLGAETLGVLVAIMNLDLGAGGRIPRHFSARQSAYRADPRGIRGVDRCISCALYRLRVAIPLRQMLGAVFAAMSVQWTVALAVATGVVREKLPFARTAKGGTTKAKHEFDAFWEAIIGVAAARRRDAGLHDQLRAGA